MAKRVTRAKTLEKAITKAQADGWKPESIGMATIIPAGWITKQNTYMGIIFSHGFAKALWSSKWEDRLEEMVLAEDPIKYLGEHLDN